MQNLSLLSIPNLNVGLGLTLILVSYALLCKLLRFRRLSQAQKKFPYRTRSDYARMTNFEAWEIQRYLACTEFPFTFEKALQFALFRTYGIPSISKLLVQTKQLAETEHAPRRYVDTVVLIREFVLFEPTSERANSAIARMNVLHGFYKGKICNEDFLYTLALFALEPKRWINRYEWRTLTELEVCALGVFWKALGDAMCISYSPLPSFETGFRDGLHWIEELEQWSKDYEEKHMVPSPTNRKVAVETTSMLLWDVPLRLHKLGFQAVSALMDERLRRAMDYPDPPKFVQNFMIGSLNTRKWLLRHFALPRPWALRLKYMVEKPDENGRYHLNMYQTEPWYTKVTIWNRYGLKALYQWAIGKPVPQPKFKPEGYMFEELGPIEFEGRGLRGYIEIREKLLKEGRGGCPFAFVKN